jgi:hypothetical protein
MKGLAALLWDSLCALWGAWSLFLIALIISFLDILNHGGLFLLPLDGATNLAASSMTFERHSYGHSIPCCHVLSMFQSSSWMRPSGRVKSSTDPLSSLIASQSTGGAFFFFFFLVVWLPCVSAWRWFSFCFRIIKLEIHMIAAMSVWSLLAPAMASQLENLFSFLPFHKDMIYLVWPCSV